MSATIFELKVGLAKKLLELEGKTLTDTEILIMGRQIDSDLMQYNFKNVPEEREHLERQIQGLNAIERSS